MDVNFKRQETPTNLMATYWQPNGNLLIWLGNILRGKVTKSILKIRNIGLAGPKTMFTFALQLINQCLVLIMSYLLIPFSPPVCEDRWKKLVFHRRF